jgi:hypothetical protein
LKRRLIVVALSAALALSVLPARAGAAIGTCTGSVRFNFDDPISTTGGTTTYNMSGTARCQTTAQAGNFKTMTFANSLGQVTSGRCGALTMQGPYVVNFFPDPSPIGGSGQSTFWGTASGGIWIWEGSNPTLVGIGVLAGAGAISCTQGGTSSITFTMSFTFADP